MVRNFSIRHCQWTLYSFDHQWKTDSEEVEGGEVLLGEEGIEAEVPEMRRGKTETILINGHYARYEISSNMRLLLSARTLGSNLGPRLLQRFYSDSTA